MAKEKIMSKAVIKVLRLLSDRWIALFLFMLAFLIRFKFRSAGLLHFDSVEYAILGEQTFKTLSLHYAHFPGHPGVILINAAFYGFFQLFGYNSEFTAIFISVFFGAMAPPLLFYLCKNLEFPRIYALYAGIIMVFFPLQWSLSEYMPTDVESLFFLLAAFYFALKKNNNSLYISSFLFMYSIAIKLENIFLLPLYLYMCILVLVHDHEEEHSRIMVVRKVFLILIIQIISLFFLYFPYIFRAKTQTEDSIVSPLIEIIPLQLWNAFNLMLDTFSVPGIILIISGIVGVFIGRKYLGLSSYIRKIIFLILSISIFNILFSASIPLRDIDRYILTGFSLLIIFATYGLMLLGKIDERIPVIILLILVSYMVYFSIPIISERHNWAGQKDFALKLKDLTGEKAVIVALDEGMHINYYSNLTIIQPEINTVKYQLDKNKSVYIISTVLAYQMGKDFSKEGKDLFQFTKVGSFLNEDWHGRALNRFVFTEEVYRITYKRD